MAQSRIAMQKIGGYDPVFIGGYEEVDLVYSMRKMGFKVVFNSDAVVHHFHNLIAFKKGRLIYGGTLMRLHFYFKHKAKIGNSDFVKNEFKLFREEFIRNFRLLISSLFKLNLNKIQISIIELFNAVFARLAIPYIVFRYKNSN
jgi:GT2 family glycosyltransferase